MIRNKKALSTVVTTLIIILLVLVAIGIIWVVINNVVTEGSDSINYSSKCLEIDVKATAVSACAFNSCEVTLKRNAGGDAFEGVKLVFKNQTTGTSDIITSLGNVEPLQTVTRTIAITGLTSNPDSVEVTPYFKDQSGMEKACMTSTLSF